MGVASSLLALGIAGTITFLGLTAMGPRIHHITIPSPPASTHNGR